MRFKKGSKVEVLTKNETTSSEWRCGEIVSGNGHTYNVRYEYSAMTSDAAMDKVPRKLIRPCAPLGKNVDSWAFGDMVEVYFKGSWKVALVKQVVGGDSYLVRLLGASEVFRVHKSNLRMRHLWKDDQWFVIGKGPGNCEGGRKSGLKHQVVSHKIMREKEKDENDCFTCRGNVHFLDSPLLTSRILKRPSPCCTSTIEASCRKLRAIESESERHWLSSASPLPLTGKVDAVAYPHGCMDVKNMHTSFVNNQTNGFHNTMRIYHDNGAAHFSERCSEPTDSIDASSVASCSVVLDGQDEFSSPMLAGSFQDGDDFSSSADSLCVGNEEEMCTFSAEDVAARTHSLELHAYRCTLESMFASGPLSWEQEAVLTNLRISLHITNDEHLTELRNLISGPILAAHWSCYQRLKMRLWLPSSLGKNVDQRVFCIR